MADYYEHGHSPFRQGDISGDETAMHRSITRGSHNSHASASATTQSWVYSNQMNPPPPLPVERSSSSGPTHFHGPRPLPEPQPVRRTPVRYPTPAIEDEEIEEDMRIDPTSLAMQHGQEYNNILTKDDGSWRSPTRGNGQDKSWRGDRSLLGKVMSGLKRIPTALKIGGGGQKSKRRLVRPETIGANGMGNTLPRYLSNPSIGPTNPEFAHRMENTLPEHLSSSSIGPSNPTTTTGITTLPRYLSNPSIGPSNPQFAHRLSMAVANGDVPPDASPSAFQSHPGPPHSTGPNSKPSITMLNHAFERYPESSRPKFPTVIRVTPPSANEAIMEEQMADVYAENTADRPQFDGHEPNPDTNDPRATVMVYNSEDSHPTITPPAQPAHIPRVSYASQPTPRSSGRVQDEPPPAPSMAFALPPISPPRGLSSIEGPGDFLSPQPTSRYTTTTLASHYDPSFSSHLTPVERFFKGLYNLPWIARERVTIDYRPADSNRAKSKLKGGVKRPMVSWYRAVVSRSRRGSRDLDLFSNGTGSASTSLGNSITPILSPTSRRSGRSSNLSRHRSSPQNHRHRKTRRRETTSTDPPYRVSPLIPPVYPHQYPPYPYTYPYGTYPPIPLPVNHTAPPRVHRNRHRAPKYPNGYAPYQPMQPPAPHAPAPMYFIAPSPPQNMEGGQGIQMMGQPAIPQGPMQISPMIMQYVPGAFNQDSALASPPITPRRTAPQSS